MTNKPAQMALISVSNVSVRDDYMWNRRTVLNAWKNRRSDSCSVSQQPYVLLPTSSSLRPPKLCTGLLGLNGKAQGVLPVMALQ